MYIYFFTIVFFTTVFLTTDYRKRGRYFFGLPSRPEPLLAKTEGVALVFALGNEGKLEAGQAETARLLPQGAQVAGARTRPLGIGRGKRVLSARSVDDNLQTGRSDSV